MASSSNNLSTLFRTCTSDTVPFRSIVNCNITRPCLPCSFGNSGYIRRSVTHSLNAFALHPKKDGLYNYLEVSLIEATSGLISSSASAVIKNERGNFMDVWEQTMRDVVSDLMRFERTTPDYLQDVVDGSAIPFQLVEKKPSFVNLDKQI